MGLDWMDHGVPYGIHEKNKFCGRYGYFGKKKLSLLPAKSAPQISPTLPIGMRMHITPEYLWLQTTSQRK